ncbi:MAG: YggU family protein [Syntrophomonadaceae bacterium]|nr:YggU family protein [Syntrophomonadaceae bacterium]
MTRIKENAGGVQIKVRVQPRASRNQVVGWMEESLKVRLTAPPVEGEANAALVRFLAEYFRLPRSAVSLITGSTSRQKIVQLVGISAAEVLRRVNS